MIMTRSDMILSITANASDLGSGSTHFLYVGTALNPLVFAAICGYFSSYVISASGSIGSSQSLKFIAFKAYEPKIPTGMDKTAIAAKAIARSKIAGARPRIYNVAFCGSRFMRFSAFW